MAFNNILALKVVVAFIDMLRRRDIRQLMTKAQMPEGITKQIEGIIIVESHTRDNQLSLIISDF